MSGYRECGKGAKAAGSGGVRGENGGTCPAGTQGAGAACRRLPVRIAVCARNCIFALRTVWDGGGGCLSVPFSAGDGAWRTGGNAAAGTGSVACALSCGDFGRGGYPLDGQ